MGDSRIGKCCCGCDWPPLGATMFIADTPAANYVYNYTPGGSPSVWRVANHMHYTIRESVDNIAVGDQFFSKFTTAAWITNGDFREWRAYNSLGPSNDDVVKYVESYDVNKLLVQTLRYYIGSYLWSWYAVGYRDDETRITALKDSLMNGTMLGTLDDITDIEAYFSASDAIPETVEALPAFRVTRVAWPRYDGREGATPGDGLATVLADIEANGWPCPI